MKKILIIEDDQLVATIYKNKLESHEFEVETALDGELGFEMIKSFQPDAVILDLMLPKVTGLELLKKIRAQEETKNLPVIVFSNTYLTNMVQEAWKAGATKCMSKANCRPQQVIEVVRSLFGNQPPAPAAVPPVTAPAPDTAPAPIIPYSSSSLPSAALEPEPAETETDTSFLLDLRQSFLAELPKTIAAARAHLQAAARSSDEATRVKYLEEMYRRIHAITGNAGMAGIAQVAMMADALEALLKELYEKPKSINASTLRTVASGVDFLGLLSESISPTDHLGTAPQFKASILVVDDEAISRRAVTYALEKAKLPSISLENPEVALNMLAANAYELIFLDVDMPGMNGFELCTKLRAMHRNKTTPVIFVTSLTDFESRANSTMSGGNDLIAKPFLFMELAVKALVYVLRGRLHAASLAATTSAPVYPSIS